MTGTSANYRPAGGSSVIMPPPIVKLVKNATLTPGTKNYPMPPNDGGTGYVDADLQTLNWTNTIVISVQVDDVLLDPKHDLEVQLHKWSERPSGRKGGGWTAPANWDPFNTVSNAGSHMLGGGAPGIQCVRHTRYKVTGQGQRIGFNVGGFFRRSSVAFYDAATSTAGNPNAVTQSDILCSLPLGKTGNLQSNPNRVMHPWARRSITGRFRFSYSIADSSGRADGRIFGPLSPVIEAGGLTMPFRQDEGASQTLGFPAANPNPNYTPQIGQHWFGERQSERG